MVTVGQRLKQQRLEIGLSLREMAREAKVSPSFLSQIENGKSQPSVATLFSLAQILGVSLDDMFNESDENSAASSDADRLRIEPDGVDPARIWSKSEFTNRISLVHPSHRAVINASAGVTWERLAATPEGSCNFMKISYDPGASSTSSGETSVHEGYEYGYVLSGILEVTVGEEVFVLRAGESIGFDCEIPHVFRNIGDDVMEGVWFIHGNHASTSGPVIRRK